MEDDILSELKDEEPKEEEPKNEPHP